MTAFDEGAFDRTNSFSDTAFDFDSTPPVVTGVEEDEKLRWRRIGAVIVFTIVGAPWLYALAT